MANTSTKNRNTNNSESSDTFEKGSLPYHVRQYLSGRKAPATVRDIATFVMKRRDYSNYGSARRSIGRVINDLVDQNFVKSSGENPTMYTLNKSRN